MPKAEIPTGYAQAVTYGAYGPSSWANVRYYSVLTQADTLAHTCDDIAFAENDLYSKCDFGNFSVNWAVRYTKVRYRDLISDIFKRTIIGTAAGTNAGGDQDAQVAYLINWDAPDIRRGGKPRSYVPGVPTDRMADSALLDSGPLSDFASGIAAWFVELADGSLPNGTTLELVEMSFVDAGVDIDPPIGYPINSGTLNHVVATQRRRVDRLR